MKKVSESIAKNAKKIFEFLEENLQTFKDVYDAVDGIKNKMPRSKEDQEPTRLDETLLSNPPSPKTTSPVKSMRLDVYGFHKVI